MAKANFFLSISKKVINSKVFGFRRRQQIPEKLCAIAPLSTISFNPYRSTIYNIREEESQKLIFFCQLEKKL